MSREEIFNKIKELIIENIEIEEEKITLDSNFQEDLWMDSLDLVELVMDLEGEYDVEVQGLELNEIKTIRDAVEYMYGILSK